MSAERRKSGDKLIVRMVRGQERIRWDEIARSHDSARVGNPEVNRLRYIATVNGTWLVLIGWHAATASVEARDRWIGWPDFLRTRRYHLIAENTHLIVLPDEDGKPNIPVAIALAARAMRQNLKTLSEDWKRTHGHPMLLAEARRCTTVLRKDCYTATGWQKLEAIPPSQDRVAQNRTASNRTVWLHPLARRAERLFCTPDEPRGWKCPTQPVRPLKKVLPPLLENFRALPDSTAGRNGLFPPVYLYSVVFFARLSGLRGSPAIADYAAGLTQPQRRDLGARPIHDKTGARVYPTPSPATVQRFLRGIDNKTFEKAGRAWIDAGGNAHLGAPVPSRPPSSRPPSSRPAPGR